ncbi:hypothetical protein ES703_09842 [subsurface metagenome]
MRKKKLKCPRCKSDNLVKGDKKVYAEYCGDCGNLIRVISIELLDKHKNWWRKKEALARLKGAGR